MDQFDNIIMTLTDIDFNQALKVTGARPYNRNDVLRSGDKWVLEHYMTHHRDVVLLSNKVLAADNPAFELGICYSPLIACAEVNLPSCRRLVLAAAKGVQKKKRTRQ